MDVATTIKRFGLEQAFDYLYKDPEKNLRKLMDWADKFSGGEFAPQRKAIREAITNPEHPYYSYVRRLVTEVDSNVMKTLAVNLFINASLDGWTRQEECRKKYDCNIPWTILLDPTSACNLHCTGCWAAEYGNKLNLTYDEIDDIIRQGKELGVYMYIYTGGEPLVRKTDLIRLCEKHSDCVFLCFTNATLIDEDFADDMELRDKNGLTEEEYLAQYRPKDYNRPSVTADIVVFRTVKADCELLLIQRGGHPYLGKWALPGGFSRESEPVSETARRELEEETHLTGIFLEPVGLFSTPGRDPRMDSLLITSSRDFRPRLRTFIISSSVLEIKSSTVLMLARLRQLKLRTLRSSSSMVISKTLSRCVSPFSTTVGLLPTFSERSVNNVKWSQRILAPRDTASRAEMVPSVQTSSVSLSKSLDVPTRVGSTV